MATVTTLMLLTICFVVASARVLNIPSVEHSDSCPPRQVIEGNKRICENDSECVGNEVCCPTSESGTFCTNPITSHRLPVENKSVEVPHDFQPVPPPIVNEMGPFGPFLPIGPVRIPPPISNTTGPFEKSVPAEKPVEVPHDFQPVPPPILNEVEPFGELVPIDSEPIPPLISKIAGPFGKSVPAEKPVEVPHDFQPVPPPILNEVEPFGELVPIDSEPILPLISKIAGPFGKFVTINLRSKVIPPEEKKSLSISGQSLFLAIMTKLLP